MIPSVDDVGGDTSRLLSRKLPRSRGPPVAYELMRSTVGEWPDRCDQAATNNIK